MSKITCFVTGAVMGLLLIEVYFGLSDTESVSVRVIESVKYLLDALKNY